MAIGLTLRARQAGVLLHDAYYRNTITAMASLPREKFIPRRSRKAAYSPMPLRIGWDQTISDPRIVAVMTAAARVEAGQAILEIGTGSGYQAAVLARLGAHVATIEIVPQLSHHAQTILKRLHVDGVDFRIGDGFHGWREKAPFDAVIVTAGAAKVPDALLDQVKIGGRLVMPIGPSAITEQILVYTKFAGGRTETCSLGAASFVPLTGKGRTEEVSSPIDGTIPLCYGAPVT